jgi:hypothetical protein
VGRAGMRDLFAVPGDFRIPGLLVRLRQPSVAPSACSLGVRIARALRAPRPTPARLRSEPSSLCDDGLTRSPAERGVKGCDHADRAPAACFVAGRTRQRCASRGVPGGAIVRNGPRRRMVVPAQWRTRHVPMSAPSACPVRLRPRNLMRPLPLPLPLLPDEPKTGYHQPR